MKKQRLPIIAKISGNSKVQIINAQILANNNNHLSIIDINSLKGKTSLINADLKIENNNGFTALLSQDDKVNVSIHMQTLSAPVLSGETVGEVCAYINDEKIYSLPITAANTIKEKNYVFYLKQLLKHLIFIDKS